MTFQMPPERVPKNVTSDGDKMRVEISDDMAAIVIVFTPECEPYIAGDVAIVPRLFETLSEEWCALLARATRDLADPQVVADLELEAEDLDE